MDCRRTRSLEPPTSRSTAPRTCSRSRGSGASPGGMSRDVRGGCQRAAVPRQGRRWAGARRPGLGARPPRAREDRHQEWPLDKSETGFGPELMELRYGTASTVFCTKFKKKDWHPRLGGGVHADAIMDRIVHNAVWVDMGEADMRQRRG